MGLEILYIVLGVIAFIGGAVLVYRAVRTYDGSEHHTYVMQKDGKDTQPILKPTTLWNPSIKVLKKKNAPDLSFVTQRPSSKEYVEDSLIVPPSGEISLRIHTCTPHPFPALTLDRHRILVKASVTFQIDVDRIETVCQLSNFGSALASRVENLFDNEIGKFRDEELRANQTTIETAVTKAMQAIEQQPGGAPFEGLPLGIHVYEASFAFEEIPPEALDGAALEAPAGAGGGPGMPRGVMWINDQQLDRIADVFRDRDPRAADALMRMLEMQTRQNIVQILGQSGTIVGFTAAELGLAAPTAVEAVPVGAAGETIEASATPPNGHAHASAAKADSVSAQDGSEPTSA